jgi:hypothetical protein
LRAGEIGHSEDGDREQGRLHEPSNPDGHEASLSCASAFVDAQVTVNTQRLFRLGVFRVTPYLN